MRRVLSGAVLVVLTLSIASCGDSETNDGAGERSSLSSEVAELRSEDSPETPDSAAELARALRAAGVDLATAPTTLLDLGDREFCGSDDFDQGESEATDSLRCFLDRHVAELDAVYVVTHPTVEGDPITAVYITGRDGRVTVLTDATRDDFGSGKWERSDARRVAVPMSPVSAWIELVDAEAAALDAPLPPAVDDPPPEWFAQREPLRWCGMDVRVEDQAMGARTCFRDAVAAGDPAEYTVGSTGDEGEVGVYWYRVLAPGRFEVMVRSLPGAPPTDTAPPSWERLSCNRIDVMEAPGFETDLLPQHEVVEPCERL